MGSLECQETGIVSFREPSCDHWAPLILFCARVGWAAVFRSHLRRYAEACAARNAALLCIVCKKRCAVCDVSFASVPHRPQYATQSKAEGPEDQPLGLCAGFRNRWAYLVSPLIACTRPHTWPGTCKQHTLSPHSSVACLLIRLVSCGPPTFDHPAPAQSWAGWAILFNSSSLFCQSCTVSLPSLGQSLPIPFRNSAVRLRPRTW